ncbi:MAG: hypothetical protein ACK42Z_08305, partial [Candidatus Kapaibacteriota bacterium]
MAGAIQNEKALKILQEEGQKDNLEITFEEFIFPGWHRGNDSLALISPYNKSLRFVALGYNPKSELITAPLIFA